MYAIYGNMDPINIPQMLAYIYIPYMDPMDIYGCKCGLSKGGVHTADFCDGKTVGKFGDLLG